MKERGKGADDNYTENFITDIQCKKHPHLSSVGICSACLKDKLVKLVCSECGEQRLSSCSCSDFSSYHDSLCMNADVGSVGRISFLIENEKPRKSNKSDEVILLRRSTSSCVEAKKHKRFWKIKRLFKKGKEIMGSEKDCTFGDKSEVWVSDILGVSRSRSLCSFRGGGFKDTDEGSASDYRFSSAKISDVTGGMFSDYDKHCGFEPRNSGTRGLFDESEPRKSGYRGVLDASEPRNSGYSCASYESEPRKSGFRGLSDEPEPRKSGFRGVLDASEPRNSGYSCTSYESEPRKSGFKGLSDEPEQRKSGFRGLLDASEPSNRGFSGVSYESESRRSGYRGLSDEPEPRKSGYRGGFDELEPRKSGFSGVSNESEPRKSGFRGVVIDPEKVKDFKNANKGCPIGLNRTLSVPNVTVFSIKESDFIALDDSAFIDLKLDSSSKTEIPPPDLDNSEDLGTKSLRHMKHNEVLGNGGSCRVTVNERVLKRGRNSSSSSYNKVWKWLSRHYSGSRTARKRDGDSIGKAIQQSKFSF